MGKNLVVNSLSEYVTSVEWIGANISWKMSRLTLLFVSIGDGGGGTCGTALSDMVNSVTAGRARTVSEGNWNWL